MALTQSFVPATNPLCWQTVWWRLAGKVVLFIFQRNLHDQPALMCLKQMYVSYSHFRKWKIDEWLLNWLRREIKLHVLLLTCTLLHLDLPLWDISFWIWRVSRKSQNRVDDPLIRRDIWHFPWQTKKTVHPVRSLLKMKMINLWFNLHQGLSCQKISVNLSQNAVLVHHCEEEKDLQSGETHRPHWNKMCQETRVSNLEKSRYWTEIQTMKLFATS